MSNSIEQDPVKREDELAIMPVKLKETEDDRSPQILNQIWGPDAG